MITINFVGDVHAKFSQYKSLLEDLDGDTIQVGDLGIGFAEWQPQPNHYFIHGNHDNPDLCKTHSDFLGRYGYVEIQGLRIFYISGAYSIDKRLRKLGIDYWENEQLNYTEGEKLLSIYDGADIVVSHDCPVSLYPFFNIRKKVKSLTPNLLQMVLEKYQPEKWIFGHHHISKTLAGNGTVFRCLAELEVYTLRK